MSATASADLQKQVEKLTLDVQRFTQDAQAEVQELQQQLQNEFQQRLEPVLSQVATEMGLQFVFNGPDAGLVWADSGARHLRRSDQEARLGQAARGEAGSAHEAAGQ